MDHAGALEWARARRDGRADVYRKLSDGEWDLGEVFAAADLDEGVASIKLLPVLEARPGVAKVATRRLLAALGIDEFVTIGEIEGRTVVMEAFGDVATGGGS